MAFNRFRKRVPFYYHRNKQEQPTLPPIEHRNMAEHQSAATASFASAEPAETDRPEPAAAFADTEVPAADEPMEIEADPAAEEIPRYKLYQSPFLTPAIHAMLL